MECGVDCEYWDNDDGYCRYLACDTLESCDEPLPCESDIEPVGQINQKGGIS